MGLLDAPALSRTQGLASIRQALAASILARLSRHESDKTALYSGTAPVWTNNTTSQITGGLLRAPRRLVPTYGTWASSTAVDMTRDPNFSYWNTPSLAFGTAYPDTLAARPPLLIGGTAQAARWAPRVGFYYDGQTFEWVGKTFSTTTRLRLRIDGRLVTLESSPVGPSVTTAALYYFKCDLGSAAMRLIEIDTIDGTGPSFGGIVAEPDAMITRGPNPTLRVCTLTDSIGAGKSAFTTGYSRLTSWVGTLGEHLGPDVAMYNAGIGGSGYGTSAIGTDDFITRVADCVAAQPDILYIEGGQNDGGLFTGAELQTMATTLYAALKAALPKTLILAVGAYSAQNPNQSRVEQDAALRAAAAAAGVGFISLLDPSGATVTGSGVPVWTVSTSYQAGDQVIHNTTGAPLTCCIAHTSGGPGTPNGNNFRHTSVFYGTGKVGATTAFGNTDVCIQNDGIHPTLRGSAVLGGRIYIGTRDYLRTLAVTGLTGLVT